MDAQLATEARLIVSGPEGTDVVALSLEPITIGRGAGNQIVLEGNDVSRRHCQIELLSDGKHQVVDLESTNGVLVNDRKVPRAVLEPFDRIRLGEFTLVYVDGDTDAAKVISLLGPLHEETGSFELPRTPPGLRERLLWLILMIQDLRTEEELYPLLDTVLEELLDGIGCERALLLLEQGELKNHRLQPVKGRNIPAELLLGGMLDPCLPRVQQAQEAERVVWGESPLAPGGSTLFIPLRSPHWQGGPERRQTPGRVQGALLLAASAPPRLNPEDVQLLKALGHQLAVLLSNARLHRQVSTDPLTELTSRGAAEQLLTEELEQAREEGHPLGVLLLDIDDFKQINDTHGHQAGDAVLRELGALLKEQVRGEDVAGRWGGEEFLVILPGTGVDGAQVAAEKIVGLVAARPFTAQELKVTLSAGIAAFPLHGTTPEDLVASADQALYKAKAAGKNRAVLFDAFGDDGEFDPARTARFIRAPAPRQEERRAARAWLRCDLRAPVPLRKGVTTLGRSDSCDVVLPHRNVSRLHGMVTVEPERILFEDCSTNGSLHNGEPVDGRVELIPGDRIGLGPFVFDVVAEQEDLGNDTVAGQVGRLETVNLCSLLERLEQDQATGKLSIQSEGRAGEILFRLGRILDARLGGLEGADAILDIVRLERGLFAFTREEIDAPRRLDIDTSELLKFCSAGKGILPCNGGCKWPGKE